MLTFAACRFASRGFNFICGGVFTACPIGYVQIHCLGYAAQEVEQSKYIGRPECGYQFLADRLACLYQFLPRLQAFGR
jgi:hypothetical protein